LKFRPNHGYFESQALAFRKISMTYYVNITKK
jgi:hypothetical protein